jgi:rfaE bifunctional protein nucleotidyltransferase chain/domain
MSQSDGPLGCQLLTIADLSAQRVIWADLGLKVVATNGCFDLLHVGHVRYLAAARALGDVLVVGLNDDASTRALKGPERPIVPLADRAEVLCALRTVDAVVPFGDETAHKIVAAARPDVYVKGGDYEGAARRPPEADLAEAYGAEVVILPYVADRSTSATIARIRGKCD